jgi:hypothetical protein
MPSIVSDIVLNQRTGRGNRRAWHHQAACAQQSQISSGDQRVSQPSNGMIRQLFRTYE